VNPVTGAARLLWVREGLGRRDHWSRDRLERHQVEGLRRLRAHALARSPWYRRTYAGLDEAPLGELPVLTREELVAHRDEIVTDPRLRGDVLERTLADHPCDPLLGRYWLVATSGSSGRPLTLPFDEAEWAHVLASFVRGSDWAGLRAGPLRRVRVATVGTTRAWHMSARAARTLPAAWSNTLSLDVAEPVDRSIERLNAWRPNLLVAYPSIAGALADEQLAGRLSIEPDVVMCGAEVLTADVRRRVESAWGARIVDHYAASETAGIASECEARRGLHLYEDLLIIEVVDADNHAVPAGVFGERLLVTVLFGRTLPLIRYALHDSVRLAEGRCPCGRPYRLLDRVAGRSEETVSLPGPGGRSVAVHPVVIHGVMDALRVAGWQVLASPGRLTVRLTGPADSAMDARVAAALRAALARLRVADPDVEIERVASIDRGPTGKAPLIATVRDERSDPLRSAARSRPGDV
jgi:phenylacetate-CoA ligase